MNASAIRLEILGTAVEDYHGLYELIWGLRVLLTNKTEEELRQLAERELRQLLAEGYVALYSRIGLGGEETRIAPGKVEAALLDKKNWSPPMTTDSTQILVGATDEGVNYYMTTSA